MTLKLMTQKLIKVLSLFVFSVTLGMTPECVILTCTQSQMNSVCCDKNGVLLNMQHADLKSLLAAGSTWTNIAHFISARMLAVRTGVCLIHGAMYRIKPEELYILSCAKGRGRRPRPLSKLIM